jgi:bifunctional ADP-heptose synthase (sugar kinase/adenylyltransferase)/phosphoglycolate phosphatase-like HAD superfamily hydrolase
MGRSELESLLADVRRVRIGIVGDFCLDAYWDLDSSLSEPSIETGLPTRAVRAQRCSLGGAGNVAANLVSLGVGVVRAFGVLGDDPFGREMLRLFAAGRIDAAGMQVQPAEWSTAVYVKPVESGAEQNRIDFGNANELDSAVGGRLLASLRAALPSLDLVVVNQQLVHGIHTPELRRHLAALVAESSRSARPVPFLADSRSFSDDYTGTMRKINDREALRLCGREWVGDEPVPLEDAERAAAELSARWGTTLFLTRGPRGILVQEPGKAQVVPGLQMLGRTDAVGAGDSALAGIAAALAAGRGAREAAELGNFTAGVTVQKLFTTGTASPSEVLAIGSDPDYVFTPELAADLRRARYHDGTGIEVVTAGSAGRRFTHAIFDNDGTVSTLREGWERIMEPVMIRAILGEGWRTVEERVHQEVQERVRDYIDKTTGIQTLVQMVGLVEMVKEFGLVPADRVLDEKGYKAVYNAELLALVRTRLGKLERGEVTAEDFTLKGSLALLADLDKAGVELHLASGTDQPDVEAEAAALGFARFFKGRIHGSIGDVNHEAKRVVLERILADIPARGLDGLVTFGDGPVEMRETRRRGGYCVGVASDEIHRSGLNPAKRTRLIRAGADLLVPDFSQRAELLAMLGVAADVPRAAATRSVAGAPVSATLERPCPGVPGGSP